MEDGQVHLRNLAGWGLEAEFNVLKYIYYYDYEE